MSSEVSKKLVARARNARTSLGESLHFGLCAELADHIEELEQQLADSQAQLVLCKAAYKELKGRIHSPGGYLDRLATAEQQRELLIDCQGWLRCDQSAEGNLRRKVKAFLEDN